MVAKPDAFLSYTRFDDRKGKISEFRTCLSEAVEEISGHPFNIFQDIEGIGLGEKWQGVLDEMLDQARFFIPLLTPKFFNSEPCRDELTKFLDLEHKTGRQDLVLPIYWITCSLLEEGHLKAKDELAQALDERQRWDWRGLRLEAFESKEVQRDLLALGAEIERARRNVLRVVETSEEVVVNGKSKLSKKPSPDLKTVPPQPKPSPTLSFQKRKTFEVFRDIDAPWCPELVQLPAGSFMMGSPETKEDQEYHEGPQHEVRFERPFAFGRYPVTFDEFDYFCDQTDREKPEDLGWGRKGWRPVIMVSHDDAEAYCAWLSKETSNRYLLPSEAQWEYACRAGTSTAYWFGDDLTKDRANYGLHIGQTSQIDAYPANGWRLQDMHGNVMEWCADHWHGSYEDAPSDGSGWLSPSTVSRVLRGGSWASVAWCARSASRSWSVPEERRSGFGFRCAQVQAS